MCRTPEKSAIAAIVLAAVQLSPLPAEAGSRALLVGVGKYQMRDADLPGIGTDIELARALAGRLGYRDEDIKELRDSEATLANIRQTFQSWLIDGSQSGDRVLFYFSGHGSQIRDSNGDEADGSDEVLVTHDTRKAGGSLQHTLVDDELSGLLKQLRGRTTVVIIDACHSGTATKSAKIGVQQFWPKVFRYPEMPVAKAGSAVEPESAAAYVALTATQDHESSLATVDGSLFTLGLMQGIERARGAGTRITPEFLRDASGEFIDKRVQHDAAYLFHPQLSGNPSLMTAALDDEPRGDGQVGSPDGGQGDVTRPPEGDTWEILEDTVRKADKTLAVRFVGTETTDTPRIRVGDMLRLEVDIPTAGYLNVLAIGPDRQTDILFPNQWVKDNRVGAGQFAFPTKEMDFDIPVGDVTGKQMVVALLSNEPLNLYQQAAKEPVGKGNTEAFLRLSEGNLNGVRSAFRPAPRKRGAEKYAGKLYVDVFK